MHPTLRQAVVLVTSFAISHTVSTALRSNTTPTGIISQVGLFIGIYALSGYAAKLACDTVANDIDEMLAIGKQLKKSWEKK